MVVELEIQGRLSGKKKNGCKMLKARINWTPKAQGKDNEDKTKPGSVLVSPEVGGLNSLLKLGFFVMEINIHT